MGAIFSTTTNFYKHCCPKCGIEYAVTDSFDDIARRDHRTFWCPNGHELNYREEDQKKGDLLALHHAEQAEAKIADLQAQVEALKAQSAKRVDSQATSVPLAPTPAASEAEPAASNTTLCFRPVPHNDNRVQCPLCEVTWNKYGSVIWIARHMQRMHSITDLSGLYALQAESKRGES